MFKLHDFSPNNLVNKTCSPSTRDTSYSELQINEALAFFYAAKPTGKQNWQVRKRSDSLMLNGKFFFGSYVESFAFVSAVYRLAIQENYFPEITFGDRFTYVSLFNTKLNGIGDNEFIILAKIDNLVNS